MHISTVMKWLGITAEQCRDTRAQVSINSRDDNFKVIKSHSHQPVPPPLVHRFDDAKDAHDDSKQETTLHYGTHFKPEDHECRNCDISFLEESNFNVTTHQAIVFAAERLYPCKTDVCTCTSCHEVTHFDGKDQNIFNFNAKRLHVHEL